jgi:ABC-2 type transport system permease protein
LAGWPPVTRMIEQITTGTTLRDVVAAFSVMTHFESFQRGVVDTSDVIFFLALIGFSLFTTGVIIRGHRAG